MNFDPNFLYGIFEAVSIEEYIDGVRTPEKSKSGMFTFTRDHRMAVVNGADSWVMAYTGSFKVKGDVIEMNIESCVVRELEGKTVTRTILRLDEQNLVVESSSGNKRAVISWKKKVSL